MRLRPGRLHAYRDSITDVHMLEVVGHPHVVNPDKELRKVAVAEGWDGFEPAARA